MLKNSQRNSAPNRSLNLKSLNTEKSTFLKPESRKMFRPIFPKVPAQLGVRTELPFVDTKQPPAPSSLKVVGPAAAIAAAEYATSAVTHLDHSFGVMVAVP